MEKYEQLKRVIQEANPEIIADWSGCAVCNTMCSVCDGRPTDKSRPICLADVLLAERMVRIEQDREFYEKQGIDVDKLLGAERKLYETSI